MVKSKKETTKVKRCAAQKSNTSLYDLSTKFGIKVDMHAFIA